jgi:hypothetical protein
MPSQSMLAVEVWLGLAKIAVKLGKVAKQFKVLELLIKHCRLGKASKETGLIMQVSLFSLLSGRIDSSVLAGTVNSVVNVAQELYVDNDATGETSKVGKLPQSLTDVWDDATGGGVSVALFAVSNHKEACWMLVERLISVCQDESSKRSNALFAAKCLLWLCHPNSTAGSTPAIKAKVASLLHETNVVVHALEPQHSLRVLADALTDEGDP